MGIIKTNDNFVHPEGKIQLLNGKVLDCYPLKQVGLIVEPTKYEQKQKENKEKRLFLNNAFLFYKHGDRIMSDSRMFLCPIPFQSHLANNGMSDFNHPTLGIYIEWWLNCESAMICKRNKTKWLVYRIAGSPSSGFNRCGIVDNEGNTNLESLDGSFSSIWSSFTSINNRYDEAKRLYRAYTLEDVINILGREGLTTANSTLINEAFQKNGWVLYHDFMRGNRYEKGNDIVTWYLGHFKLNGKSVSNEYIYDMLHIVVGF